MFEFTGDNTAYRVNIQRPHHWPRVFIFTISPSFPFGLSQCDHWKNRIKRRNPKAKSKRREKSKTDHYLEWPQSFCIHVCVHTIFFVRPEGFYVILWSVRSYWWWWRLVTQDKGLSRVTQSITSFSLVVFHLFFAPSYSLPCNHTHSRMIIARLWMLWFLVLYGVSDTVRLFEMKASLSSIILER